MTSKEIAYEPLERSSDDNSDDGLLQHYAKNSRRQRWFSAALALYILALMISNGIWLGVYLHQKNAHGTTSSLRVVYVVR